VTRPKINFIINKELFPDNFNFRVFRNFVEKISADVLECENQDLNLININFCTDSEIKEVNKKYLGHDYETDIITFRYDEKDFFESDMLISVETVKRNSLQYKNSFIIEVYRVIIHGLLHLCGFDDYNRVQKQKMRVKENFYLNKLLNKE
jgi:probable rRNA maturation factor